MVDDNPAKRLALKAVLLPLGYSIVEADSGLAALRCVMAQDFAVILLDVRMPIMDGFETAALIRQRQQSEMTPIIFITAHASDEIVEHRPLRRRRGRLHLRPGPAGRASSQGLGLRQPLHQGGGARRRAREVQTSADQLRLLTDAAPIGIFQTDAENRIRLHQPALDRDHRHPSRRGGRAGVGHHHRLGGARRPYRRAARRCRVSGRALPSIRDTASGSASRIVLVTSKPIPDSDGGIAGWVGTLADVTAEAGAEAAMSDARDKATEASRLKSDFLANMSHEIRTPMNGVIGMTDLLLETDLDARQRDYAQTVRNSGEALLTIINDILDFSKVEAGKLEIEDIEFNLRTIVDDVVDLLAGPAQTKGLELVAVIESSVPAVVSGDPGRVRQVLTNLIGNAIKFTQAGEIVVRVTEAEVVGADTVVRFEVSDTGDGIAPDKLALVFQPFVQADTSTSRKYGGTGLGPRHQRPAGRAHGRRLRRVQPARGGKHVLVHDLRSRRRRAGPDLLSPDADLAGVTVLIVDDNATQRSVLSEYLTDWGMTVTTADSGQAALATMRTAATQGRPFAVALLDRSMPGMDGLELKDAIVDDPALTARLVLMTGLGQDGDLGDAAESGSALVVQAGPPRGSPRVPASRLGLRRGRRSPTEAVTAPCPTVRRTRSRPAAPRRRQPDQPEGRGRDAVQRRLPRRHGAQRRGGSAGGRRAQRYDAILMDCQMPELNGYEATAAIRAHEGFRPAHPDHRHDRRRAPGRPRALPGRGHGQLPRQAGQQGRAARPGGPSVKNDRSPVAPGAVHGHLGRRDHDRPGGARRASRSRARPPSRISSPSSSISSSTTPNRGSSSSARRSTRRRRRGRAHRAQHQGKRRPARWSPTRVVVRSPRNARPPPGRLSDGRDRPPRGRVRLPGAAPRT